MTRLSFQYDGAGNHETAQYKGLTIQVFRDEHAENPFRAWEGEPPTIVYSGRDSVSDYSKGEAEGALEALTDYQISRNWRAICNALDVAETAHDVEAKQNARDYETSLAMARRSLFEEALSDKKPSYYSGNADDYLSALATLWGLAGVVAVTWSSCGYSQGDYASGLSVATPEWAKAIGAPLAGHKAQCEYAGKLWGFWAWGDVYGYQVKTADGDDVASIWGFYGDHDASGLEESAIDSIDSALAHAAKVKTERLKVLVKSRVPFDKRSELLSEAYQSALTE